jgi:hypothetical protein
MKPTCPAIFSARNPGHRASCVWQQQYEHHPRPGRAQRPVKHPRSGRGHAELRGPSADTPALGTQVTVTDTSGK